jgi:DNA ligase (NAD+)
MDSIDRNTLSYDIDGIVFKLNDISDAQAMGANSEGRKPKSNRAVKFPLQQVPAEIKEISWTIGKTGKLVPVAILFPVKLNDTTVQRVTLHNVKFIEEMELKIGSEILIQKAGEIIPYCVRKLSDKAHAKPISTPIFCPACQNKLEWDETHTTKLCSNISCHSQVGAKIEYFCKTLDIKGIGSSTIDTLIEKKRVKSISDMYDLSIYMSELKEVFGDRAFEVILEAMASVKEISLAKFIQSLSIANIGTMSKSIVEIAPTIKDIDKLTENDMLSISGFGSVKAKNFIEGWKSMRSEIDKILKHIKIEEKKLNSNKLGNKSYCITGTLSKGRSEFQAIIEANGGKVASSVSAKLDYLICGEDCGSKKDKAEKLGVKTISEKEFMKMIE